MKNRANRYWIKAVFFLLVSLGFPISSIAQNIAPTVSLTAPAANAVFTAPANITLTATAADSDGTVTKVEFFRGTTLIGTDTTAPYSFSWTSAVAGSYSLTAKATDNLGATKTSTAVAIIVNALPTATLAAPANGATFVPPASIALTATATDSDGTIAKVEFFNGATLIATDTTSPYSFTWASVASGSYTLTAKSTDNRGGATTSSPVAITVNALPTVSLTAPASGAVFSAPANVTMTATAADSDGTVSKVEFFNGTTLLGTATTAPYTFTWSNVAAGSYSLTAKATDNRGATRTSTAAAIVVNALPTATLTAPANGATFVPPASIALTATATDSDGTIAKVEFFNGSTLIATDTTSPYSFTWASVASGSYTLTAKSTDNRSGATTSSPVAITVNALPTVSLTAPAAGAVFSAPANVTMTATATDSDGTVSKVEFFNGATLLGTATTSPYTFTWSNVAAGSYSLTAKATDNLGGVKTSTAVAITVNSLPAVSLTAPANGASFSPPANVALTAIATDSDGTITKVEFFNGATLLGTDTTSPYSFAWNAVGSGSYTVTAKATDNRSAVTTSAPVTIIVNAQPTATLTAPSNGATFVAPATINLTANASDSDGTITKVEFFNGATLVGTDTTAPYSFSWASVPQGTYALTAKATDNQGAVVTSSVINVTVNAPNVAPTISLTAPTRGASLTAPANVTLTATASDSDGTVTKVEFFNGATLLGSATSVPYSFAWSNVAAGSYTLSAKATDNQGAVTTSSSANITVNAPNVPPVVSLTAPTDGATFTAPASISLTANASDTDGTISTVEFFNGTALLGSSTTSPYSYNWANVPAGSYSLTARATDNNSAVTTSAVVAITVSAANTPPSVSLTGPANGATFPEPATIPLSANASDSDGTVSKVEFFNGATLLGTDATAPYTYAWTNVANGTYTLTAKATDNQGATTSSSPISVVVAGVAANGPINFVYDENGRLVGVSDVNGTSARYQYDSVGNIVRIGRGNAGDVTILGFSPATGPVGTTVTISGTGFSATATDNAVRFAGHMATILTATTTQLTVSVPAGAVDGPIGLTAPSGSATTSTNFVVAGSSNLPTITTFTPTSGGPGTSITITGTNFDAAVDYNRVSVNGKAIALTSANATTLIGTIPAGTSSGRISVLTPRGVATSSQYLYVAPSGIASASIETTGAVAVGDTATVTTSTVGGAGLRIFEGTVGQHLQINIVDVNYLNCTYGHYGYLSIYDPNGQKLSSITTCHNEFLDLVLPTSGSYSMLVDPFGTDAGSLTFTLKNAPPDVTGTALVDGSTTTVTTILPGQNIRLSFSATAGQRIVLRPLNISFDCSKATAKILAPDGSLLESAYDFCGSVLIGVLIPQSGSYSMFIDPQGALTGTLSMRLDVVPDITGTIVIGGPPVLVPTGLLGQIATLTFNATAGQSIFLNFPPNGGCQYDVRVTIFQGSRAMGTTFACYGYSGIGPIAITASGTYTVLIRPDRAIQTPISLRLTDATPVKDTIVVGGGPVSASLPNLGQVARLEFNGTIGQHIKLTLNSSTATGCVTTEFYDPANWPLHDACLASGGSTEVTLGSNGTFTVTLKPPYTESANIAASLSPIFDTQGVITIGGPPVSITTSVPERNTQLFFTATAGQRVYAKLESSAFGNCEYGRLGVVATANLEENHTNLCPPLYVPEFTLPRSGTYILSIDPYAGDIGSAVVSLVEPLPDTAVNTVIDAPGVTLATSIHQKARLNFSGSAGQLVRIAATGATYSDCHYAWASLVEPNGTRIANFANACEGSDAMTLPTTGDYIVVIDSGDHIGNANWAIASVTEALGTITTDGTITTISTGVAGQIARLAFTGNSGQHIKLEVVNSTYTGCLGTVKILDSSGSSLTSMSMCSGGIIDTLLPVTGPYSVVISPHAAEMGLMSLRLTTINDVRTAIALDGAPVSVITFGSDSYAILDFLATGGKRVSAGISSSTYTNCSAGIMQMLNPAYDAIAVSYFNGVCGGAFIEPVTLPTSGNFKILLNVTSTGAGTASVNLYDVPADVIGSLDGGLPTVAITAPGQNAKMSFSVAAGDFATVHVTNNTIGCAYFRLRASDGLSIDFADTCLTNFDLPTFTPLPGSTLNYVLEIDPHGAATGSINVRVSRP